MLSVHIQPYQVRYYECDAYGHMNNTNYLRYMQEAAFEASAAAGYNLQRYNEIGHHWLARRTRIEFLRPLRYGDRVLVKTWVQDHRGPRSLRRYEFRLDGSDILATQAETDWVYRSDDTGLPENIPAEMLAGFFPEGIPPTAPRRAPFPTPEPPPEGVFRLRRRVEWREIDSMLHVNNAAYLAYVEDAGFKVAAAFGWPVKRMWDEGFAVMLRQHEIEYRLPAYLDEELEIVTWIGGFKKATSVRNFAVNRVSDGALLARIRSLWAWVDTQTGRAIRIPEVFLMDFAANVSPQEDGHTDNPTTWRGGRTPFVPTT